MSKRSKKNKLKKEFETLKTTKEFIPSIQPPDIQIDFIDHTDEGIQFLELIQKQMNYKLNVDNYHFHYFLGANDEFIGVVEIQIFEDLNSATITNALFNYQWREVGLALMVEVFGDSFETVHIGDVGRNSIPLVTNKQMSRLFNPWDRSEIKSTMLRKLNNDELENLEMD